MGDPAVIGPLGTDIPLLALENGEDLAIGSEMLLIGYPAEFDEFPQPTITRGILSRFREWEQIGITYFQTDAAIAGGQSGGVLISESGNVIGISGFRFSEAAFGLVASAADVRPRAMGLIGGEDVAGLGDRRIPLDGGRNRHTFSIENSRSGPIFVINELIGRKGRYRS